VSTLIRGEGFAGRTVVVELFARDAEAPSASANSIGQQKITFDTDEQVIPLEFPFEPAEICCWKYASRLRPTTNMPTTIAAKRRCRSSRCKLASCLWRAVRRATIDSCVINYDATAMPPSMSCCRERRREFRRTPINFSTNFLGPKKTSIRTTASWPSIPIGLCSMPSRPSCWKLGSQKKRAG